MSFPAAVCCFMVVKVSGGWCHLWLVPDVTSLAAPTCTPPCSCSPLSPSCPNSILSRKTAFLWASSPLLDAPMLLWHCCDSHQSMLCSY